MDRYEDFYGCEYHYYLFYDGTVRLVGYTSNGIRFHDKIYKSQRGANIALGKISEGTARMIRG